VLPLPDIPVEPPLNVKPVPGGTHEELSSGAERLPERLRLYLKREDLNHTGAHKLNNALGQVLLARRLGKTRVVAETTGLVRRERPRGAP